jgi:hypothetical protein
VADIVAIGSGSREHLSQQLGWLSAAAGDRFPRIELSSAFFPLPEGDDRARQATAAFLRRLGADLDTWMAARPANLLMGSTAAMVEQLEAVRETFGITYAATSQDLMDAFAPVVAQLANR